MALTQWSVLSNIGHFLLFGREMRRHCGRRRRRHRGICSPVVNILRRESISPQAEIEIFISPLLTLSTVFSKRRRGCRCRYRRRRFYSSRVNE